MRPCRKCGVDDRTSSGHCRPCEKVRNTARIRSVTQVTKPCVKCGDVDRNKRGDCKPCQQKRRRAWFEANKNEIQEKSCPNCGVVERDKHGTCIPCRRVRGREWARENAVHVNPRNRLKKYGLTEAQFQAMHKVQGGQCAVCADALPERYHIDHDHKTGQVRGLLCHSCNLGLGQFGDDSAILRKAAEYLDRFAGSLLRRVV